MTQNDFYNLYNMETTCITWESQFGGINETMCKIAVLHIVKKKKKQINASCGFTVAVFSKELDWDTNFLPEVKS